MIIVTAGVILVGCNGGGSGGGGSSPTPGPNPQPLTSLGVVVSPAVGSLIDGSIDAREFAISPVVNITYTNNEAFTVVLRADTNFPSSPDCGIPNSGNICPQIISFPDYAKYSNQCNSNTGQTTTLQPGQSCIQSFRVKNGWNFTSSEKLLFTDNGGYSYYKVNEPTRSGAGKINLSALIGITQDLGEVGGFNYYMRMLPTPDANYFYRIIPNTNGNLGKYQITYNDTNHTAVLNITPVSTVPIPYQRVIQTALVGIANNGDPIGVYGAATPNLVNYVNSIEYGVGDPEVLNGYDDVFLGLDGNNYAVNGTNSGGAFFTGDTIASLVPGSNVITHLPVPKISGNYLVTQEGNIVYSGANQYCYMKSTGYTQQVVNLGTAPKWIDLSGTNHNIYAIGNKVYMFFLTTSGTGYWFGINGGNCSVNWDDTRTILLQSYYGAANYGIYTNNNRVLYGIWDTGHVLYYPYPPVN